MMTREQRDNCERVLGTVRKLPEQQVNISQWARPTTDRGLLSRVFSLPPMEQRGLPGCGTQACMAGWAVITLAPIQMVIGGTLVALSREWAEERGIESLRRGLDFYLDTPVNPDLAVYEIPDIGAKLLGRLAEHWFLITDGPTFAKMTDKAWIIWKLEEVIRAYDQGDITPEMSLPKYLRREVNPNAPPDTLRDWE